MKPKSKLAALLALASIGNIVKPNNVKRFSRETKAQREERFLNAEISSNIKKGLTEFYFLKGRVWALNEKSAHKKAMKQNLL